MRRCITALFGYGRGRWCTLGLWRSASFAANAKTNGPRPTTMISVTPSPATIAAVRSEWTIIEIFPCPWFAQTNAGAPFTPSSPESADMCATCGNDFIPKRSDAKYCSVACKQKAYRARRRPGGPRFSKRVIAFRLSGHATWSRSEGKVSTSC